MNRKIVFVSDFSFQGSGYMNISIPLCSEMARRGHEIKAIGLGYRGEEHWFDFSIIPCGTYNDAYVMTNNLFYQWKPDVVVVALDVPHLEKFSVMCKQLGIPLVVITPLENPPLTFSWAQILSNIDKVFFISEFATQEGLKNGVDSSEHLVVGMDTKAWRLRTEEEYQAGRKMLNISDDTITILTVADNQERKNLSKAMEIVSKLKHEKKKKVKYILVTRENSSVGWKLRDLAMYYNISSDVMIFERGMPFKELYALYALSDVFLLTSKAEGLCMPVLEAMSVGVPVVVTETEIMKELTQENRGITIETEYSMIDPWGNSRRDFPNADNATEKIISLIELESIYYKGLDNAKRAREYMETRTWEAPTTSLEKAIEELCQIKQN